MLTRRQIRIKVMQALYASSCFPENEQNPTAKKLLKDSIFSIQGLYISYWTFFLALHEYAKKMSLANKNRYIKDLHQDYYNPFSENRVLELIGKNDFQKKTPKKLKVVDWDFNSKYVQIIHDEATNFLENLDRENSFGADKKNLIFLFCEVIAPNEKLREIFEETHIAWLDDIPLINTLTLKFLEHVTPSSEPSSIFLETLKNSSHEDFAYTLMEQTLIESTTMTPIIQEKALNWEIDRIAKIDTIIIKMALTEALHFPNIPKKVILNEYIEISKDYATPKSYLFVNGIIDKVIKEFEEKGKL